MGRGWYGFYVSSTFMRKFFGFTEYVILSAGTDH